MKKLLVGFFLANTVSLIILVALLYVNEQLRSLLLTLLAWILAALIAGLVAGYVTKKRAIVAGPTATLMLLTTAVVSIVEIQRGVIVSAFYSTYIFFALIPIIIFFGLCGSRLGQSRSRNQRRLATSTSQSNSKGTADPISRIA